MNDIARKEGFLQEESCVETLRINTRQPGRAQPLISYLQEPHSHLKGSSGQWRGCEHLYGAQVTGGGEERRGLQKVQLRKRWPCRRLGCEEHELNGKKRREEVMKAGAEPLRS